MNYLKYRAILRCCFFAFFTNSSATCNAPAWHKCVESNPFFRMVNKSFDFSGPKSITNFRVSASISTKGVFVSPATVRTTFG